MVSAFRACVKWSVEQGQFWAIGMSDPIPAEVMAWLTSSYRVLDYRVLPSGTIALRLAVSDEQRRFLRRLPGGSGGSFHESNILW